MLKDLLHGDPSIDGRDDYSAISYNDIVNAMKVIVENPNLSEKDKIFYLENSWKIHYRGEKPPPTIKEFLSVEYLGPSAESVFPYVKNTLLNFWDINSEYRNLILSPSVSWGKSFTSVVSTLYITTHLILMKDINKFFGLSKASVIVQALISFTKEKAHELLLQPFLNILESTDKFEKCRTLDTLKKKNKEFGVEKFFYTTANPTSALTFSNGVNIKIISNVTHLLGINILSAVFSELAFFSDRGFSDEYIMRILNDTKGRIFSRFKDGETVNYFARTIIDSSPNSMESKIDQYIHEEAPKDKTNFIIKGAIWEWKTWEYVDVKKTFPVFKGTNSKPPKLLPLDYDTTIYSIEDVLNVPDTFALRSLFENDLIKALKDHGGIPAGSGNKLIENKDIIEKMFVPNIKNLYSCIYAPYTKKPEGLIFNLIKDEFFYKIEENHYEFYRYPTALRYLSVDQAEKKDNAGIAMGHYEMLPNGDSVYVVDFSIVIEPNKSRINLDAIKFFITDLIKYGKINIAYTSFDQYQSSPTRQYLERENVKIERLSVDISTVPYLSFISAMNIRKIKMGKNIYMKNNLKSLIMGKTKGGKKKVDHVLGTTVSSREDNGNWEKSLLGFYGKDLSDAVVACYTLAEKYGKPNSQFTYSVEQEKIQRKSTKKELTNIKDILFKQEGFAFRE